MKGISTRTRHAAAVLASFALVLSGCAVQTIPEAEPDQVEVATESPVPETTPTTQPASEPKAGDECERMGKTFTSGDISLECRYQAGMKLAYVEIEESLIVPVAEISSAPLDICRIQDRRQERGGGATSFPARGERMRVDGQLDLAVIAIDFPDRQARQKIEDYLFPQIEIFNQTFEFWAGDNESVKWHIPPTWLRMPKEAKYYQWDHSTVQGDGSRKPDSNSQLMSVAEQQFDIFSEAEKVMELQDVDFAFVIAAPEAREILFAPYSADRSFRTATSVYDFPHYGYGTVIMQGWKSRGWTSLYHEMLHFRGLAGHAPGNEFPYNLMAAGESLTVWDAFLLGWQDDNQLICLDGKNLTGETFQIGSMDLDVQGPRGAVVKVDNQTALVIESRRKGTYNQMIPDGFAGIQAYVVDSTRQAERFDGNIERENDYFAYHLRIDSLDHFAISEVPQNYVRGYPDLNETAFPGDSFTFRGIKVEYLEGGDFDTIRLSSENGVLPASQRDKRDLEKALLLAREPQGTKFCGCCGCFPGEKLH